MAQLNFAGEYKVTDLKLMTSSGNVVELGATYLAIDLYEDNVVFQGKLLAVWRKV